MKKTLLFLILIFSVSILFSQTNCATALLISSGTHTVPSITGSATSSSCNLPAGTNAMYYKYVATQNGVVTVTTDLQGLNVNTQVRVFSGISCPISACIASNDDYNGVASKVSFVVSSGYTYIIVFDNKWSSNGFDFKLEEYVRPQNLTFTGQAANITGSYNNCIVDMNGDYLDDIVSPINSSQLIIYYQQPTGGFNNVTYNIPSTTVMPSWSIAAGDYDNNGYNDLVYGSGSGIAFVKANNTGTGYTSDRKPQSFLVQRTNFVDINNDGKLDAFICDDNAPNRYFLNDGINMNHYQGGMGDFPSGGNYASIFVDYDNDGDMDLHISKCNGGGSGVGGNIDELLINNGNGTYTNVAASANMANATQTWSSAWGDFNNDGWMDVLIGSNSSSNGYSKLMKNNGDGTFTDITLGSGYDSIMHLGREYVAHDFDNDGFLDVLGAGNVIMFGDGNFKFVPNPTNLFIDNYDRPIGDLNNDGFLDYQRLNTIMLNNGNSNKWLKVTLEGVQSNRNGIGARVEIHGVWGKQIRDVQSGTGFANMSTLNTHFGIGQATEISKVVVKWPSGTIDVIDNVNPNTTLFVKEGSTLGTSEIKNIDELFTIYPNPTDDIINFITNKKFVTTNAKIYDLSGKMVFTTNLESNTISIKHLSSGTYLLVLLDKFGNSSSQKIVKK